MLNWFIYGGCHYNDNCPAALEVSGIGCKLNDQARFGLIKVNQLNFNGEDILKTRATCQFIAG